MLPLRERPLLGRPPSAEVHLQSIVSNHSDRSNSHSSNDKQY